MNRSTERSCHDAGIAAAFGHSRPAPRVLHPRGRRLRRHLCKPQWRHRLARRSRAMSPKIAGGWPSRWASRRSIFSACIQIHSPDVVVATGPWHGASRPRADAIVTRTEGLAIGATAADCGPILLADPKRARDRRGACGLEGRADRHPGIHHRCDGKTRRRTRRHGRRDRPLDPPAQLRSRRRIRRAVHARPMRRMRCSSFPPRAKAMRCSILRASSGCGSKTPAS